MKKVSPLLREQHSQAEPIMPPLEAFVQRCSYRLRECKVVVCKSRYRILKKVPPGDGNYCVSLTSPRVVYFGGIAFLCGEFRRSIMGTIGRIRAVALSNSGTFH